MTLVMIVSFTSLFLLQSLVLYKQVAFQEEMRQSLRDMHLDVVYLLSVVRCLHGSETTCTDQAPPDQQEPRG